MIESIHGTSSRREFVKNTGRIAVASALAGATIPYVHAGEDNTIRLALVGSGSRGSGAVGDAVAANAGPVQLVAMADLFPDRLDASHRALAKECGDAVDVPRERQFLGFDAYRKAIDSLRPGDVAILSTHAAFRATHLAYAVEKGVHVFMEKTFAPDPGGVRQILNAGEAAERKNLKIAAGLMCRHSASRQAMVQKIRDGAMGDILLMRAYRMDDRGGFGPRKAEGREVLWQLRQPQQQSLLWVSAGVFIDLMIHQIDECCWIKDSWPVAAHGVGGRTANSMDSSQNLDSYSVEYTFVDGARALVTGRYIPNCFSDFATYAQGTKCAGQFSGAVHSPTTMIYRGPVCVSRQHRLEAGPREDESLSGGMERAFVGDPRRQTAQRDPEGSVFQSGGRHGPGGCSQRKGRHLGGCDGIDVSVLPERGRIDGRQPIAGPGRRAGTLPGACARRMVGNLNWCPRPSGKGVLCTVTSKRRAL